MCSSRFVFRIRYAYIINACHQKKSAAKSTANFSNRFCDRLQTQFNQSYLSTLSNLLKEILQHRPSLWRQDRLRMELDALNVVFFMADAHDDPVLGLGRDG